MARVKKSAKQQILSKVSEFSCYDFDGKVIDIISMLQEQIVKHGPDVRMGYVERNNGGYNASSYGFDVELFREETDEEYNSRIAQQKAQKDRAKEHDLAVLNKLLKTYGVPKNVK
jgi:hypothetical protein